MSVQKRLSVEEQIEIKIHYDRVEQN